MEKKFVLIVSSTMERGMFFLNDEIQNLIPDLERKAHNTFENNSVRFKVVSMSNPDMLRGYRADTVILEDYCCDINMYNDIILPIVKYDHNLIKVMM